MKSKWTFMQERDKKNNKKYGGKNRGTHNWKGRRKLPWNEEKNIKEQLWVTAKRKKIEEPPPKKTRKEEKQANIYEMGQEVEQY